MIPVEYLAGFVDGEGYLGLSRIPRRNGSREYCLRLCVYNSNLPALKEIQRTWGGTLSAPGRRHPSWKPAYALIWTNAAAARVIRKVEPFLISKSRQAHALLAFDERIQTQRKRLRSRDRAGRLLPMTKREARAREAVYLRLKWMNRRGPGGQRQRLVGLSPRERFGPSARYVAGFMDGEGSLMITKAQVANCRSPQYHPNISLANTNRSVLVLIQRNYGGILARQPARKLSWNDAYQLIWTDGRVEPLLSSVGRYLRIKSQQARILVNFVRKQRAVRRNRQAGPIPAEVPAFKEGLRRRIRKLNRKGSSRNAS
jgi:hypothetical protein